MATPKHTNTVTRLLVENFMRVRSVDIAPEQIGLVELHGANAQGKSSLLRAMWSALGGKGESPKKPVRDGEQQARARVELGDLVIERTWRPDGSSRMEAFNQDGATYSSPQRMLDTLIERVAFDPIAFTRMEPKKQAELLASVAGIDTAEAEAEVARLYDQRRVQGKLVQAAETRLGERPEEPAEVADTATLSEELEAIQSAQRAADAARADSERHTRAIESAADAIERVEAQISELKQNRDALAEAHFKLVTESESVAQAAQAADNALDQCRAMQEVMDDLSGAQAAADARSRWERWQESAKEVEAERIKHETLDKQIEAARAALDKLVQSGTYPVEGLAVTQDGVMFNGMPFEQASSAEQLRVSMAMAMATNPDLKIVHIKEGSLLDTASLELVRDMAVEEGFQVWVEVVDDSGKRGLVIEDGEVRSDTGPA